MDLSNLNWEKSDGIMAYQARGFRGARYGLIRNAYNPSHLFPVSVRSLRVFSGRYTDRNGKIEKVA